MKYTQVLSRLHNLLQPKLYLEIGVKRGVSLALCQGKAIAIDPRMNLVPADLRQRPEIRSFEMESDRFFNEHAENVLGSERIDFAFIDGLHLSEQVARDFLNVERWSHPDAVVAIHDVYPADAVTAHRHPTRGQGAWAGDVWKVVPFLQQHRPDLRLRLLNARRTGLLLVHGLDPTDPRKFAAIDDLVPNEPLDHSTSDGLFESYRDELERLLEDPRAFLNELSQRLDSGGS